MKQFPFAHTIEMTHRLRDGVLEVATRIDNLSVEPMPVAIGFHPFFQLTDSPRDEWTLSVAARTHWPVSEAKMPTGVTQPIDKFFANPAAVQLAPLELDDVFSDLVRDARAGDDVAERQSAAAGRGARRQLSRRRDLRAEARAGPGRRGAQLCVHRTGRGDHQRAEPRPQRRVQRAAEHPSRWCLAGEFLDSSQRFLVMSRPIAFVLSVGLLTGISQAQSPREITFDEIARPKPGEWPSYNGHLSANRHSPLDQINTRNVATLEPKWTHEMGGKRALQMTPLVIDGVMYVAAVNEARALDARTGQQIWQFVRPQTPGLVPTGDPASGINRGDRRARHIACFFRPITRTCWPSIDGPDSFSGTSRWRTIARITARPARCSSSTIW